MINDVADQLFAAIERGDYDAVESLWTEDVLVWHTGDPKDNQRRRALKVIRWFMDVTTTRSYEILDRQFFEGGFVQQHILRARRADDVSIDLRVCIVIKVNTDGLITRIDEYFDPVDMAPILENQGAWTVAGRDFAGHWRLDPTRSTIAFRSPSMWGLMKVKGTFAEVTGTADAAPPNLVSGGLVIDAASVDTGIGKRDDHLRSADFFEVQKFPTIEATVDSVELPEAGLDALPAALTLRTDLTIKGIRRPVELPATVTLLDDGAVQIVANGALDRIEFGVDGNLMGMMSDTTYVEATAVFLLQS